MAYRPDSSCISTEREYTAARHELDALLGAIDGPVDEYRVDELLELIENYESAQRFVPDWSDESFRNAA